MKRQIPNILTCCNLICGCIAAFFAFYSVSFAGARAAADTHGFAMLVNCYKMAFFFILLGAVFDFFDGFVARLLKVSGPIGVQLDSLADVVTFGVAPGAMIFSLFSNVYYPGAMQGHAWFAFIPYLAFLLPAFAAYRLAKFNVDERQHDGFLGLPTPACAIFWAALIYSSPKYLLSQHFNAIYLIIFMLVFCYLMVSEIPMFSLKFKGFDWNLPGNKMRYVFLVLAVIALTAAAVWGALENLLVQYMSRSLVGIIVLYIFISIGNMYVTMKKNEMSSYE
jgi:CDP-diacylglycerol--serine O-phosphatidyltransferase